MNLRWNEEKLHAVLYTKVDYIEIRQWVAIMMQDAPKIT